MTNSATNLLGCPWARKPIRDEAINLSGLSIGKASCIEDASSFSGFLVDDGGDIHSMTARHCFPGMRDGDLFGASGGPRPSADGPGHPRIIHLMQNRLPCIAKTVSIILHFRSHTITNLSYLHYRTLAHDQKHTYTHHTHRLQTHTPTTNTDTDYKHRHRLQTQTPTRYLKQ